MRPLGDPLIEQNNRYLRTLWGIYIPRNAESYYKNCDNTRPPRDIPGFSGPTFIPPGLDFSSAGGKREMIGPFGRKSEETLNDFGGKHMGNQWV